ncbi:hypothetical protein [Cellulomonas sp. PhB143]|uniref:hypothetical protein n=1 Tax=Cellulomonas sp. PhB143 TaxID=2485186 RepID=UPI000F4646EF|nr:hypothetical protein [Cellulomonas sp. PhB143]ROS79204.1 hypothetical protein EDF32_0088 [Cellulomonas sp. PhB143]
MSTARLWWLLRRRTAQHHDAQRVTTALAVVAFGTATALLLVVLGGVAAFFARAGVTPWPGAGARGDVGPVPAAGSYTAVYPVLAGVAALLLLVPLVTLGGAAARLAVARRDARLATVRLVGGTTAQVTAITALDAGAQALAGGLCGVVGYGLLVPLVARVRFEGRPFAVAELWVGVPVLALAVLGVVAVALVSALLGLRRVVVTPLGVAARTTPPRLRWARLAPFALAFVGLLVAMRTPWASTAVVVAVLSGLLLAGFSALNLLGPFVVGIAGRLVARRARAVPTLLAGRRIVDDPRTAWRSVGGVALATFIACLTSAFALAGPGTGTDPAEAQYLVDLRTGGFLTLAIAALLAAVSTGVMQAGRVIDQRDQYRALVLAGADVRTLDRARFRETALPLATAVGAAVVASLLFMVPVIGAGAVTDAAVLVQLVLAVAGAVALVLAGASASRPVARVVVRSAATG